MRTTRSSEPWRGHASGRRLLRGWPLLVASLLVLGSQQTSAPGATSPSTVAHPGKPAGGAAGSGPSSVASRPVAQVTSAGNWTMAVTGSDGSLWTRSGSTWAGLGGRLLGNPTVVTAGPSPLFVVTGTDGGIWERTPDAGWRRYAATGYCIGGPGATVVGSTLTVACRGGDNGLWYSQAAVGSGLPSGGGWQPLGGRMIASPAVAAVGDVLNFFVVGTDGQVWPRTLTTGFMRPTSWACRGHLATAAGSAATTFACQGTDRGLWYATNSGGGWSPVRTLGGQLIGGPGVADTAGGLTFAVEGTDRQAYVRTVGSAWSTLGGVLRNGAALTAVLGVATSSLQRGVVGFPYSANLTASGGYRPYSWTLSSGALPAGLRLDPSGSISGTPTAAGASGFGVTVTDQAGTTSTAALSLIINPPNHLAQTPPMGWNPWYGFNCNVDEQLIKRTADAMVSSGMQAAGYEYVNLDDCWQTRYRDANGNLQADPTRFPDGIKALADYVHAKGLKFGIYTDVGTQTCGGFPGGYGHYQQDANTFAAWGVDFVKVDWCNVPFADFPGQSNQQVAKQLYTAYSQALQSTDRSMVFSICEWDPSAQPWTWAPAISNMWRTNFDYADTWDLVLRNLDQQAPLAQYAGPGHWNDPDILQVGLPGMTDAQDQAHFSMWAMMAAPLLATNELSTMSPATAAILTNPDVIAIDQDPAGQQAIRVAHSSAADVWTKPLGNGDRAVLLLNRGTTPQTIRTTAAAVGLPAANTYAVRDLWAKTTAESAGSIVAAVPPQSAKLFRISVLPTDRANQFPPLTAVSVDPNLPAAYPGSSFHLARPGQAISVAAAFENAGPLPVTNVSLAVTGPLGWRVSGAPVSAAAVGTNQQVSGSWQVTVPPGTAAGSYPLVATATYHWSATAPPVSSSETLPLQVVVPPTGTPYLSGLPWLTATNGYGPVLVNKNSYGGPLNIHGTVYPNGLWTNADASIFYYLGGNCRRFTVDLGLDASDGGPGSVVYQLYADGTKIYDSGTVTNSTATLHVDTGEVTGANVLQLVVGDAGDGMSYDNADFGSPQLTCG